MSVHACRRVGEEVALTRSLGDEVRQPAGRSGEGRGSPDSPISRLKKERLAETLDAEGSPG